MKKPKILITTKKIKRSLIKRKKVKRNIWICIVQTLHNVHVKEKLMQSWVAMKNYIVQYKFFRAVLKIIHALLVNLVLVKLRLLKVWL